MDPPQCMPDEFKLENVIEAYKNFYINDKVKVKKLDWKKFKLTSKRKGDLFVIVDLD